MILKIIFFLARCMFLESLRFHRPFGQIDAILRRSWTFPESSKTSRHNWNFSGLELCLRFIKTQKLLSKSPSYFQDCFKIFSKLVYPCTKLGQQVYRQFSDSTRCFSISPNLRTAFQEIFKTLRNLYRSFKAIPDLFRTVLKVFQPRFWTILGFTKMFQVFPICTKLDNTLSRLLDLCKY